MTDKPRIRLHVWYDCGWRYEQWTCINSWTHPGCGKTPSEAYKQWALINGVKNA